MYLLKKSVNGLHKFPQPTNKKLNMGNAYSKSSRYGRKLDKDQKGVLYA